MLLSLGTFYGDDNGVWVGEMGFQFTLAPYRLDLQHYKHNINQYKAQMNDLVYPALKELEAQSVNRNAAQNMLYWMVMCF